MLSAAAARARPWLQPRRFKYSYLKEPGSTTTTKPGKLILIRHGESTWNASKLFTGWVDIDLSERGAREVEHAARLLLEQGFKVDVVYTSVLKRAIKSTMILLDELRQTYRPVVKDWRLNERHYGALQGLSKSGLAESWGLENAKRVRTAFDTRPPKLPVAHTLSPLRERKYAEVDASRLPLTESLRDCLERVRPLWHERIEPDLAAGHDVLVVAHGNSLRGLVKEIDGIDDEAIENVSIPNAIPLVYHFDRVSETNNITINTGASATKGLAAGARLKPRRAEPRGEGDVVTTAILSGEFLEEKGLLRMALQREAERPQEEFAEQTDQKSLSVLSPLERSLTTLESRRRFFADDVVEESMPLSPLETMKKDCDAAFKMTMRTKRRKRRSIRFPTPGSPEPPPLLVIIRHGKTEHNKLGLFTGWEDAPLAPEGRAEATAAGELMRAHGVKLDVVYTSWLSRAIETAWLALTPLDMVWLPIVKTWRLNERMYGALTGLSKRMIQQEYGEVQFKRWRRGYDERPPPVSPFSVHYPGNDERYTQYLHDLPVSAFQTVIRSLAHGRFEVHHRLPQAESLRDCMERTLPYYLDTIVPQALAKRKNVLIASSENAIRGLLMHLCAIPPEHVPNVEIPTGIPLLYDFEHQCVKLLDDQLMPPPRQRYNFGVRGDLLFTPREHRRDDATPQAESRDPHIYLDDVFVINEKDAECDLEKQANEEACVRVEEFCGVREPRVKISTTCDRVPLRPF